MNNNVTLRLETERDHRAVERLTRDAFWDIYKPGCDEHLLAHQLRGVKAFPPYEKHTTDTQLKSH